MESRKKETNKQNPRKRGQTCLCQRWALGEAELDAGGQKAHTPSDQINRNWGGNVPRDDWSSHSHLVAWKVVKTVFTKGSYHKEKTHSFSFAVSNRY